MNENRPSSSFRSADSKRKHGLPLSTLAKAETGVSTSATRSTISGTRLPRFASSRNSSRNGVIECRRVGAIEPGRLSLWRDDLRVVPNFSEGRSLSRQRIYGLMEQAWCVIIALPSKRGCSSVVEHLLAKEDVASSSLVTRSIFFQFLGRCGALFFESKSHPVCISLPKDEYENIGSLHVFNCVGCCGSGPTGSSHPAGTSNSAFGFSDGERVTQFESSR